LPAARRRLSHAAHVDLVCASFLDVKLPRCDGIGSCIALHHIPVPAQKQALYAACREALRPGARLISADCFPAREPVLATRQREAWVAHLERSYSRAEAEGLLSSWAGEDTYFPLDEELQWLRQAGLEPEVLWRVDAFAVIAALRPVEPS
jgi:SAM-dependent methyltransferase